MIFMVFIGVGRYPHTHTRGSLSLVTHPACCPPLRRRPPRGRWCPAPHLRASRAQSQWSSSRMAASTASSVSSRVQPRLAAYVPDGAPPPCALPSSTHTHGQLRALDRHAPSTLETCPPLRRRPPRGRWCPAPRPGPRAATAPPPRAGRRTTWETGLKARLRLYTRIGISSA
jgi:hypothetical protein